MIFTKKQLDMLQFMVKNHIHANEGLVHAYKEKMSRVKRNDVLFRIWSERLDELTKDLNELEAINLRLTSFSTILRKRETTVVVLNDGETFSPINGSTIRTYSEKLEGDLPEDDDSLITTITL